MYESIFYIYLSIKIVPKLIDIWFLFEEDAFVAV